MPKKRTTGDPKGLIQNYGLFWRREHVFWGRGSNAGHLQGVPTFAKTSDPVDFRNQQGIYCLYDDNFRLVYVGQTGSGEHNRLFNRLKAHRDDQLADRWTKFSWFGLCRVLRSGELAKAAATKGSVPLPRVLNHMEGILIAAGEPAHNLQRARFGKTVHAYRQHRDRERVPNTEEMIRDIWRDGF